MGQGRPDRKPSLHSGLEVDKVERSRQACARSRQHRGVELPGKVKDQ